jgi:hypothetical protein
MSHSKILVSVHISIIIPALHEVTEQVVSISNNSDLLLGGARFESWPGP